MKALLTLLVLLSTSAWAEGKKYKATIDVDPSEKQESLESANEEKDEKREPASEEPGQPDIKIHVNEVPGSFR